MKLRKGSVPMDATQRTIDMTPTWREAAQMIAAVLENGTDHGRDLARAELYRMAELLDQHIADAGAEPGR